MRLPEIKQRLDELAKEIETLASQISRRTPAKRAPRVSARATAELREKIRAFAIRHPTWPQTRIADKFNVNPGRVSEALRGKRK